VNAAKRSWTRKWTRLKVDIRVKIRRWEEPEEASSVVRTYELSEGGMSVYASETLDIGTFLQVVLTLPGAARPLRFRAVVRNRRGFRCGLEFVDPPAAEKSELASFLAMLEGSGESEPQ
jgi:c-di-GMP-binding flagellar brake protein YcgR